MGNRRIPGKILIIAHGTSKQMVNPGLQTIAQAVSARSTYHKCIREGRYLIMKRVLGLVISPRKLGNSELLVKEIMSSIPEKCSRELIRLTDLKIKPCKACYQCLQPDKICGAQGILKDDNTPDFTDADYCRFSNKELEEHFKVWLVEMKQRFLDEKERLKEVQKEYRDKDWWIKP